MRDAVVKAYAVGVMTGSLFTAGILAVAAPAKADIDPDAVKYAARYGAAVCATLDDYPTTAGILGIGEAIVEDGLTSTEAGEVIGLSITDICPRYTGLLRAFIRQYGAAVTA